MFTLVFFYFLKCRIILLCLEHSSHTAYVWQLQTTDVFLRGTIIFFNTIIYIICLLLIFSTVSFPDQKLREGKDNTCCSQIEIHTPTTKCLVCNMLKKNFFNDQIHKFSRQGLQCFFDSHLSLYEVQKYDTVGWCEISMLIITLCFLTINYAISLGKSIESLLFDPQRA